MVEVVTTRINPINFVRIVQGTRPLGAIILVKFQFFKVLWAVNPPPEPIKVKFGREERISLPNFTLIGATCCPQNRPVSKNNIGR